MPQTRRAAQKFLEPASDRRGVGITATGRELNWRECGLIQQRATLIHPIPYFEESSNTNLLPRSAKLVLRDGWPAWTERSEGSPGVSCKRRPAQATRSENIEQHFSACSRIGALLSADQPTISGGTSISRGKPCLACASEEEQTWNAVRGSDGVSQWLTIRPSFKRMRWNGRTGSGETGKLDLPHSGPEQGFLNGVDCPKGAVSPRGPAISGSSSPA